MKQHLSFLAIVVLTGIVSCALTAWYVTPKPMEESNIVIETPLPPPVPAPSKLEAEPVVSPPDFFDRYRRRK